MIIPEVPIYNWHIEYLCDLLEEYAVRVRDRQPKLDDLIVNIPPGTTKSTIVSVMFPAWLWTLDPTLRVMTVSYSDSLATDHAVKSRDIVRSPDYQYMFPGVRIKSDHDNKTNYKNNANGERYATSIGGTVTGFHAHVIVMDDLINPKKSASDVSLNESHDFVDKTISTRKVDKEVTITILVMQRLHENDPTGYILRKQGKSVRHVNLPAELNDKVSPVELKERYEAAGGLLDPVRLSHKILKEMKTDLGSYGYAGQFQQEPAPEGGDIWQRWFIEVPDHLFPERALMDKYGTDWDTAYTEKTANASSAYIVSGLVRDGDYKGKMAIDNLGWFNKEFPGLIAEMRELPDPHYIEAKASGKSAKQTLTTAGIAAIEVQVNSDKLARARDATPKAEAGMVIIRKSLADRIYNDHQQGILKFPNGEKADLADTVAQAIQRHFGSPQNWWFGN